jgi:protein-disulfide isomerase
VLLVVAACWSSSTKDLERKVDALSSELASSRGDVQTLQRRVGELENEQKQNSELQAKLEQLEKVLAATIAPPPPPTLSPPPPPRRAGLDPTKTYAVSITNAHLDGPADAKVTMIIADEYACPYCERVRPTLVDLRKKYGKDLRIAYRQYVVHPMQATASALAICAATKQRKHDKLDALLWEKGFRQRVYDQPVQRPDGTQQSCWETREGCPLVLGFAKEAGLNVTRFKRDMHGPCIPELAETTRELQAFGVGATPTFFINGRYMSGAQPMESYSVVIDEELQKANERIKKGTRRASYFQEWVLDRGEKMASP